MKSSTSVKARSEIEQALRIVDIQDLHQKLLSMDFPQTAFYLSKDNYLEVTAKHVSKEHALLEVAKY